MAPPANAYNPGTRLTVGSHQVVITRYFSHGGFAQVYLCSITPSLNGSSIACLKRVVVPDKQSLNILRMEVDAMRKLRGKPHIVSYIDSNASRSPMGTGGYEVLVLMEYCAKGGLIDFMNTRLVQRLSEHEILTIISQITEAVAYMHALSPPIIHRDIKIENVLLSENGVYKLCDFGSSAGPLSSPKSIEQFQILQDDIMKNTTPQYRSPEMLDLYKGDPIDEKSDIWALGVFLYKLCYFTTPFEQNSINGNGNAGGGDYAILNCIYSFPAQPVYSARLKNIIAKILVPNPKMRPNVNQLLDELCKMMGTPTPVIPKQQVAMQQHSTNNPAQQSIVNKPKISSSLMSTSNNTISSFQNSPHLSVNRPSTPTKKANNAYSSASSIASNGAESIYSLLPPTTPSNSIKRIQSPPILGAGEPVTTPKLRANNSSSNLGRRRPVSMYGSTPDFTQSREDLSSLINDLKVEDVDLSIDNKRDNNETISSSMDFIRNLSRQNTNNSITGSKLDHSTGSKWKKRSSISSLKDLLTGGSSSHLPSTSSVSRKSSAEINTPRRSKSSSSRGMESSLADVKEMSPDNKIIKKPAVKISLESNKHKKKSSKIQEATNKLFRRSIDGDKFTKTANGYGKYTDELNLHGARKTEVTKPIVNGARKTDIKNSMANGAKKIDVIKPIANSTNIDVFKPNISGAIKKDVSKPVAKAPTKKAPPPRPKKPTYLKSNSSQSTPNVIIDEELELMEQKFYKRFPPPPKV